MFSVGVAILCLLLILVEAAWVSKMTRCDIRDHDCFFFFAHEAWYVVFTYCECFHNIHRYSITTPLHCSQGRHHEKKLCLFVVLTSTADYILPCSMLCSEEISCAVCMLDPAIMVVSIAFLVLCFANLSLVGGLPLLAKWVFSACMAEWLQW